MTSPLSVCWLASRVLRGKIIKSWGDKKAHEPGNVETIQTFITEGWCGVPTNVKHLNSVLTPISQISMLCQGQGPLPQLLQTLHQVVKWLILTCLVITVAPSRYYYDHNYSFYCHSEQNQFNQMMVVMAFEVLHETIREMILSFNCQLLVRLWCRPGLAQSGKDSRVKIVFSLSCDWQVIKVIMAAWWHSY